MSNKIIAICWDHSFVPIDFRDLISLDSNTIKKVINLSKDINAVSELAILSTCNRIEFYAFSKNNEDLFCFIKSVYKKFLNKEIPWEKHKPKIFRDIEAIEHLNRVAIGIESMVYGEKQILKQVELCKMLMNNSSNSNYNKLNNILINVIRCAQGIQAKYKLSNSNKSISDVVIQIYKEYYPKVINNGILVIGTGDMAKDILKGLELEKKLNIIIASNHELRAKQIANRKKTSYINIDNIPKVISKVDIVICATCVNKYNINNYDLEYFESQRKTPLLFIDICTPRFVQPLNKDYHYINLYDLDYLNSFLEQRKKNNNANINEIDRIIKNSSQEIFEMLSLNVLEEELIYNE